MELKDYALRIKERVEQQHDVVPLNDAVFLWNHEPDSSGNWLEEACVVVPHMMPNVDAHEFSSSTGADSEGWPNAPYNNPGFVFGQLIFSQWETESERISALAEFAKVDGLHWAREILRGVACKVGAFTGNDDESCWSEIKTISDVERFRDAILMVIDPVEQ